MLGNDATATTDRTIAKTLKSKDGKSTYLLEEDVTTGDTIIKKINKAPQTAPVILVNSILSIAVFSVGFGFFNFTVALLASSNVTMQAVEPRLNDHFERNVKCPILLSK